MSASIGNRLKALEAKVEPVGGDVWIASSEAELEAKLAEWKREGVPPPAHIIVYVKAPKRETSQ